MDGEDLGQADDYDGMPGYLILHAGQHRLEIRARGRETLVLDVDVQPGWLLRLDDALNRGEPGTESYRDIGAPPGYDQPDGSEKRRDGDDGAYENDDEDESDERGELRLEASESPAPGPRMDAYVRPTRVRR